MALYKLKKGTHLSRGVVYKIGDEIELPLTRAEALGFDRLEQVFVSEEQQRSVSGEAAEEGVQDVDAVDWTNVLKSSSVSKILLLIKGINDKNSLSSLLDVEQKGQNRAKIIEAVNSRMMVIGGES